MTIIELAQRRNYLTVLEQRDNACIWRRQLDAQIQPISSRRTTASITSTPSATVVERRQVGEFLAAVGLEDSRGSRRRAPPASPGSRPRSPAPRAPVASRPPSASRFDRLVGIGLQPGIVAEARLECRQPAVLRPAELLAQEPRRLLALAVIGIALAPDTSAACRGTWR